MTLSAPHSRILTGTMLVLGLFLGGCNDFNEGKTKNIIEAAPVRLDAEQVMLTGPQVECGVREELWESPVQAGEGLLKANLTAKGRGLKFDDDVVVTQPGYRQPFVQVRGEFPLGVLELLDALEGPEKDTKLVHLRVGVRVDHPCFGGPLPLLGLKKGSFSEDVPPVLLFRLDNGWQLEKFLH